MAGPSDFFDSFANPQDETDAERRARIRKELAQGGADTLTNNDLLDMIGELMDRPNPFIDNAAAEDAFRSGLQTPGSDPFANFRNANQAGKSNPNYGAFENARNTVLSNLIAQYVSGTTPQGPAPAVIQLPNDNSVFNSVVADATGVSPESEFRNVFSGAFPDISQGTSPFNDFVKAQENELKGRFLQNTYNEFTSPGFIDSLKSDYETLARQGDNQRINREGGSIPSFEDYIKGRVQSNYKTFLESEKPKLQQAFEMASPQDRGQRQTATIAPPRRIL